MNLAAPQMLWMLPVLVGPMIAFLWWAWRRRQQLIAQFVPERLAHLKVGVSNSRQKARMVLLVVAVVLLVMALARPQWGLTNEEVRQRGLDIIVALDTSNSMLAEDVPPNRLTRAKLAALDLVRKAKTDRLGLIAFAGTAFMQCPLTLDDAAFSQSVDALDTHSISEGGTALGQAIGEARRAFKGDSENHKVLVLFTDGEDHDSDAVAAAKEAADEGMIIFTIGIGTPEGEVLRIRDARGRIESIKDESGKEVKSHLNEELLGDIARATKGFYLRLQGTKTMDTLYEHGIAPLPKFEGTARTFQRFRERFYWPLGLAMALLVLEMFLPNRKRRRASQASPGVGQAATALAETVVIVMLLAMPFAANAGGGASTALREYNEGKYQDALRDYNRLTERRKDDPRLQFNAGAAAYQSQQMEEAAKRFSNALSSPDLQMQQQTYYNLGNTLYRLGEQAPDMDKKKESWEKALKQFESALKLNEKDGDAKFNREFVQKQIEELKKQESQQNKDQQKQDQKDNKDQKDQKDQNKQDQKDGKDQQNKDDQSKNDQSKTNQNSQAKNDQKKDPQQDQKQNEQAKNDASKQDKKDYDQQKKPGEGKPDEKSAEDAAREAAMMAAGQMTPSQAMQLLDAQKGDEQVLRMVPTNRPNMQGRPFKNW